MRGKHDRAAELRAIADGRLMLNVRNGVTVPRPMLAKIADEFEAISTALEAQAAELAEVRQQYVDANEARIDAEAQLAEARKALDGLLKPFEDDNCRYDHHGYCQAHFLQEGDECCVKIARGAREGGKADG